MIYKDMMETIVPITVLIISLVGAKRRGDVDFLSNDQGKILKGISAVFLVIIHIREHLEIIPMSYRILSTGGFLFVSVFFFYSGFGIAKKVINNKEYLTKGLPHRIAYLYGLILISEVVYYVISVVVFGKSFYILDMVESVVGIKLINGACWTIVAMIVIQSVFYVCYRSGIRRLYICAIIACVVYIIITLLRRKPAWEIQSCFAFVLGTITAENEDRVQGIIKKTRAMIGIFFIFVLSFSFPYISEVLLQKDYFVVRVVFGTLSSLSFISLILFFISRIEINNALVEILGSASTEIYLWHGLLISIIKFIFPGKFAAANNYVMLSYAILLFVIMIAIILGRTKQVIRMGRE